jgi:membrane-associated phospholipid phosphatase
MDYRLYHWVNVQVAHHREVAHVFARIESIGVVALAAATVGLWLLARPSGPRRWKLASACALASAGLALLVNQAVASFWSRARPYATHPGAYHLTGSRDPSFPSDHASAAFGIAWAVLFFDRLAGSLFLAAAVLIGVGRVLIGAHYPADVAAGILVGLAAAAVVVKLARPVIALLVRLVERVTDPLLEPLWRQGRRG